MEEIWKDVVGCEGSYQVSNLGRVKSVSRVIIRSNGWPHPVRERILKPAKKSDGYLSCALCVDKKLRAFAVHRLVASAFLINSLPDGADATVDHINGVKTDNRAENLEYVTRRENIIRSFKMGLQPSKNGVLNGMAKLTQAQADMIRECYGHRLNQCCKKGSKPFSSRWLAKAFKTNKSTVLKIISGEAYRNQRV